MLRCWRRHRLRKDWLVEQNQPVVARRGGKSEAQLVLVEVVRRDIERFEPSNDGVEDQGLKGLFVQRVIGRCFSLERIGYRRTGDRTVHRGGDKIDRVEASIRRMDG